MTDLLLPTNLMVSVEMTSGCDRVGLLLSATWPITYTSCCDLNVPVNIQHTIINDFISK